MQNHIRARFRIWPLVFILGSWLSGVGPVFAQTLPAPVHLVEPDSDLEIAPPYVGYWLPHEDGAVEVLGTAGHAPSAPHRILQSPAPAQSTSVLQAHSTTHRPSHPTIPAAVVEPRWKTPYAYGYFGAQPKKHWTRSTGYRDIYKRWTYR